MSNNFEYLDYMNVNNSGNRNGNSNMNRYNRGNNKKNVTLREFEKEAVSKKELQHFRNVFMDLLVKDYEQPFSLELELIKKRRGEEEYRQDVKRIYERLGKMRESAEETLLDVKRYLDYVEVKDNSGEARLYLPGIEEKTRIGKIKLPDLLGFTQTTAKKEQYGSFILGMVRTFLGFEGKSLWRAMRYLEKYLEELSRYSNSSSLYVGMCEKFASEPELWPLFKVNAYYDLLQMMEKGEFDINKFLDKKKEKNRDRGSDRDRDRDRDRGKKKKRSIFGGGEDDKDKGRESGRDRRDRPGRDRGRDGDRGRGKKDRKDRKGKGGLRGELRLVGDKGDNVEKKLEYILRMESKVEGEKTRVNEMMDKVRRNLRETGMQIFVNRAGITGEEFIKISKYGKVEEIKEMREEVVERVMGNNELFEMGRSDLEGKEVEIVDFYTGRKRYLVKGSRLSGKNDGTLFGLDNKCRNGKRNENDNENRNGDDNEGDRYLGMDDDDYNYSGGEGVSKDDKMAVYILVRSYGEMYRVYDYGNLPMSEDSSLQSLKNAVLILNGLVIYINVLREMIILLEGKLMDDVAVRKLEEGKKENKEKRERIEMELRQGKARYLEYREILRELDKQIMAEKNGNKLNRLRKLKEEVLRKGGITNE